MLTTLDAGLQARLEPLAARVAQSQGPEATAAILVVEIKGYRKEDAKEKKATMDTYWIPGVNNLGRFGRWAFAELTQVYEIETDFNRKLTEALDAMIARVRAL